jgi:hypothetical protein
MPAPRGDRYIPKSGPLMGRIFTGTPGTTQAYNRYQQARAHALGFSSYRHQRQVQQSPIFRGLLTDLGNKNSGKRPSNAQREDMLRALGERQKVEAVQRKGRTIQRFKLDVDFTDHSRGGSYDLYLQRIGRRIGNEEWLPGETP